MDGLLAKSCLCALEPAGHDFVLLERRAGLQGIGKGARERCEKEAG